jgi:hypothetical protein
VGDEVYTQAAETPITLTSCFTLLAKRSNRQTTTTSNHATAGTNHESIEAGPTLLCAIGLVGLNLLQSEQV